MSFQNVTKLEKKLAKFYNAPYAVAVDCCTHGVELCLRYSKDKAITVPKRTYLSIPFLAHKLNIELKWKDEDWIDYYYLTDRVIDAAVLWKKDSYIPGTFMNISFQFQKHLSLGRGGVILTDSKEAAEQLKMMTYDGRIPETANKGLLKWDEAVKTQPKQWVVSDWPDLTQMDIFKNSL